LKLVPAEQIINNLKSGKPVFYQDALILGDIDLRDLYVFCWHKIPGKDSDRLKKYIAQKFNIEWVETAKIEKINDDTIIKMFTEKESLFLKLNDKKTEVVLEIDDDRTIKFIADVGNDELNIYALEQRNQLSTVDSQINIISSTILGEFHSDNVIFMDKISFEKTIFIKPIRFKNAIFCKSVNFQGSKFNGLASFIEIRFDEQANFSDVTFLQDATFLKTKFKYRSIFSKVRFEGIADFRETYFENYTLFSNAKFSKSSFFDKAKFLKSVSFFKTYLDGNSSFVDVEFCDKLDFDSASFGQNAKFIGATFLKTANFTNISFFNDVDFEHTGFYDYSDFTKTYFGRKVSFNRSIINFMLLSNIVLATGSCMELKHSKFSCLEVDWDTIKNYLVYDGSSYLALVKNYNDLEWFNDADDCYYQYRSLRRECQIKGLRSKITDYIAWIAYGYGVRPSNPLKLSLGLLVISSLIFLFGVGFDDPFASVLNASYISVTVFTSNPKTDPLAGIYLLWGVVERIAGWLLMASFLVVLAKKTIR
jgi:uncharacterized protein YjbI with pentapeptide repeats